MTFSTFQSDLENMDNEVKIHYAKMGIKESGYVNDGAINREEYFNSQIKILWILKEPYSGQENEMLNDLNEMRAAGKKTDSQSTWHPLIYISHGILNGFINYDQMPNIAEDKSISKILRKISFINVKKNPGKSRSKNNDIAKAYQENKELLSKQIETLKPDIIIGANTMQYFVNDLKLTEKFKDYHWIKDGQLYIKTYHPAQIVITRKEYVDKVIAVAKAWRDKYKPDYK
jgi:hypothetical protein